MANEFQLYRKILYEVCDAAIEKFLEKKEQGKIGWNDIGNWSDENEPLDLLNDELIELRNAQTPNEQLREIGDVVNYLVFYFAIANPILDIYG